MNSASALTRRPSVPPGLSRGFCKGLPVVGSAVGAGMNKALTRRVGWRCQEELARRVLFEDVTVAP